MESIYYEFREAADVQELEQLLRLRYVVYKESRLAHFTNESDKGLDLDAFDLNSQHFGLFLVENGHQSPIAYHRIVDNMPSPLTGEIRTIAAANDFSLPEPISEVPFPIMTYCPTADAIHKHYLEVKKGNLRCQEATKFSLSREHRSLLLAKHVVESEVAIHLLHRKVDFAITACTPAHSRFYARFGFQQFPGTDDFVHEGVPGRVLLATAASIPSQVISRLTSMAEAYAKSGSVCCNLSEPDNFFAPQGGSCMDRPVGVLAA